MYRTASDRTSRCLPTAALALALALAWSPHAVALTSDREQPIELEADSARIDERTGVSVYTGNVKVTQGSAKLLADRLTVTRGEDGDKLVAEGKPASFSQLPDDKPVPVKGRALTIDYHTGNEVVVLTGDAEVWQGGDRFASERIVYDSAKDLVRGGQASPGAKPGERVKIVIQPRENSPADKKNKP
jgi:lipopolysaccharide export system protein LptA